MPGRRALLLLLGAAVRVVFLLLAIRQLDRAHFVAHVRQARFGQIALGIVCLFSYYGVKVERWKLLIAPFGVDNDHALAASVIYNALMVVPAVALGLPGLRRAGSELTERLAGR